MKVTVLAGGTSTERDVSLVSGSMIYKALKANGHKAVLVDVYLGLDMPEEELSDIFESDVDWAANISAISENDPDIESIKASRKGEGDGFFGPNVLKLCKLSDAVFMALHGESGEDGKIQATLELLGIPYTGTGYSSSAIAMNKGIAKDIFKAWGIPTPKGIRIGKNTGDEDIEGSGERIAYPCIVKTISGGSSVGVAIARNDEEYVRAKEEAFRYGKEAIVEEYIEGREFAIGVIEGEALPVIEIAPKQGFYDYKNKYQAGSTVETCPAKLSAEDTERMQWIAERVFKALRLKAYARMDFMMDKQGNIYCLEANTLPGMTPMSLLPQEAKACGMSFEELCEKLLNVSLKNV